MELDNRMVSAEWLKNKYYEICDECNSSVIFIDRIIDEIDDAPDVELVRCKDCRYRIHDKVTNEWFCNSLHSGFVYAKPNDFCSYGERKDNE